MARRSKQADLPEATRCEGFSVFCQSFHFSNRLSICLSVRCLLPFMSVHHAGLSIPYPVATFADKVINDLFLSTQRIRRKRGDQTPFGRAVLRFLIGWQHWKKSVFRRISEGGKWWVTLKEYSRKSTEDFIIFASFLYLASLFLLSVFYLYSCYTALLKGVKRWCCIYEGRPAFFCLKNNRSFFEKHPRQNHPVSKNFFWAAPLQAIFTYFCSFYPHDNTPMNAGYFFYPKQKDVIITQNINLFILLSISCSGKLFEQIARIKNSTTRAARF